MHFDTDVNPDINNNLLDNPVNHLLVQVCSIELDDVGDKLQELHDEAR